MCRLESYYQIRTALLPHLYVITIFVDYKIVDFRLVPLSFLAKSKRDNCIRIPCCCVSSFIGVGAGVNSVKNHV